MGKLNPFKKPKVDKSAIEAQEKRLAEQEAALAKEEEERKKKEEAALNARRGRSSGRASLLTGLETGINTEDQKRGNLG